MKNIFLSVLIILLMFSSILPVYAAVEKGTSGGTIGKGVSISLINQDPYPAAAGNVLEIRLGIENRGELSVNDLIIEFVPEYPFELVTGEEPKQKITNLRPWQEGEDMKIIKYKLRVDREATAGIYDLYLKYYEEISKATIQKSIPIEIKNRESAEVIHIDKSILIPGKQSGLKFTINNVGNAPLRDITFNWENEDKVILPVGSDNTKYIRYIDVGESASLEYQVIADNNAEPGLYELDLYLSYDEVSGEKEIHTMAGVYVGGKTDFDVAFSETSTSGTSFTIANIGSNPAFSVSVKVPQQQGWRIGGSNSMIIGNLNKGDYTVASFDLQGRAADEIKIQIDYTDTMGERRTVEKLVGVNVQTGIVSSEEDSSDNMAAMRANFRGRMQQQGFFSKYKWYILVLILVGGGVLFYRHYKKEKTKNPNLKLKEMFKFKKIKKLFKKK